MMTYYLMTAGSILLFSLFTLLMDKKLNNTPSKQAWLFKGIAIALSLVFGVRCMSRVVALLDMDTYGLNVNSPFGVNGFATLVCALLLWATFAVHTLLVTYPFYKEKIHILTPLVKWFASPVLLLNVILLKNQLIGIGGKDSFQNVTLQGVAFCLELGIGIALCLSTWLKNREITFNAKRLGKGVFFVAMMLIVAMPYYLPQVLFGFGPSSIIIDDLTPAHRIVLYVGILIPVAVVLALNKYDYDHKRYALLFLAWATMISYSAKYTFPNFLDLTSWPLHLCNTAMFIVPLCLVFKLDKLFYFTMFINVLGSFFAMAMPNVGEGYSVLESRTIEFWLNHYCAFCMPIILIFAKLYERPKMKVFTYSLVAFFLYFLLVLVLNAYLTNYDEGIDFFFINSDFIAEKLGTWAEDLRNITATIPLADGKKMVFYPIYQVLFFLVYVALSFGMWFLYELVFQTEDLYVDIFHRYKKIKVDQLALEVSLAGRDISEPLNMEATNKLILKNFTKQYANSDVYAVHNANLEIEGGQVFGFLGPNGAGKSTIIKSIVGIQPVSEGSITVCGYDVETQPVGAKMQTGFVPDHYALYENLTGREYVNYIADLYNISKEDRTARIDEYIERFRLQGSFDNPIKTYSHGMKQKITIMSALVHNPKLWILDEPLTGLDPESIFQVKEAMKAHAKAGNIVFFSSHIIDVVERICDQIAIIKKGHILCQCNVKDLEAQGIQLEAFYMDKIENTDVDSDPVEKKKTEISLTNEAQHD